MGYRFLLTLILAAMSELHAGDNAEILALPADGLPIGRPFHYAAAPDSIGRWPDNRDVRITTGSTGLGGEEESHYWHGARRANHALIELA